MVTINKYELLRNGIYADYATPAKDIRAMIRSLWPVQPKNGLIRVGGSNDGGFILADDLEGIDRCFSAGDGNIANFEKSLLASFGIESHLIDFSAEEPPAGFQAASFTRRLVGYGSNAQATFIDDWINEFADPEEGDYLLQVDIEGAEYAAFLNISERNLNKFRQISVEFHDIESWANPSFFKIAKLAFSLLGRNHVPIHIRPNSNAPVVSIGGIQAPRVFAITYLRKDRLGTFKYRHDFPHDHDRPSSLVLKEVVLPAEWYAPKKINNPSIDELFELCKGIIHVGANTGQERDVYEANGLEVIWVEADEVCFAALQKNIQQKSGQNAIRALLLECADEFVDFYISNNARLSSSVLKLAEHKEIWPDVGFVGSVKLKSETLSRIVSRENLCLELYDCLVLDVQGAEMRVLEGGLDCLKEFRFILAEAANFEIYEKCVQLEDLADFLAGFGFRECDRRLFASDKSGRQCLDVLFVNDEPVCRGAL